MKLQLNPIFEKLSGKLKGLVFVSYKEQIDGIATYIRSSPKRVRSKSQKQKNLNRAFQILSQKYKKLKTDTPSFATWQTEANKLKREQNRSWTAYKLFQSYFMKKYTQTIGLPTEPIDLSPGASFSYNDRSTRTWNTNSTYSVGPYGTGTYGS